MFFPIYKHPEPIFLVFLIRFLFPWSLPQKGVKGGSGCTAFEKRDVAQSGQNHELHRRAIRARTHARFKNRPRTHLYRTVIQALYKKYRALMPGSKCQK